LAAKGCLSWLFWGGAAATIGAVGRRDLLWGVVQCQAIMVVYGLSGLVRRSSIKYPWIVTIRAVFSGKKEMINSNQMTHRLVFFSKRHHFGVMV